MFLVKAGTVIQIETPKSEKFWYTTGWKPWTTAQDKIYDKDEVWDAVAVANDRDDVPEWARRNITEHGLTVIKRAGKYAMVRPRDMEFLD